MYGRGLGPLEKKEKSENEGLDSCVSALFIKESVCCTPPACLKAKVTLPECQIKKNLNSEKNEF